jgi:hypothetical protein
MQKKKSEVPFWKSCLKASFMVYFVSLFFVGKNITFLGLPDYQVGFILATLLFFASIALATAAVLSKKKADALKSNTGPSDSDTSLT